MDIPKITMDNQDMATGSCPHLPLKRDDQGQKPRPSHGTSWNIVDSSIDGSQEITIPIQKHSIDSHRQSRTPSISFLTPRQTEEEIEHRLSQPRKSIIVLQGAETPEVAMVPLLFNNQRDRRRRHISVTSQRSERSDNDQDAKYNLTYVDLMSMQLYGKGFILKNQYLLPAKHSLSW